MDTMTDNTRSIHTAEPADSAAVGLRMEKEILAERRATRRRNTAAAWSLRLAVAAVAIFVWWLASYEHWVSPLMVSGPGSVAKAFVQQLSEGSFWTDAASTFGGAMAGLTAGAALGILTGVIFSRSALLERAMAPFLTFANSLPRPALAPIFILWFGLGFMPKAMVAASVVYFVLLTSTLSGLRGIDHDIQLLTQSLTMSARQRFLKVELPSALPSIVGGLRLGVVYSILGAVLSEMVGAYSGLGQRLTALTANFHVADAFAILVAMGVMTMALDLVVSGIEKLVRNSAR